MKTRKSQGKYVILPFNPQQVGGYHPRYPEQYGASIWSSIYDAVIKPVYKSVIKPVGETVFDEVIKPTYDDLVKPVGGELNKGLKSIGLKPSDVISAVGVPLATAYGGPAGATAANLANTALRQSGNGKKRRAKKPVKKKPVQKGGAKRNKVGRPRNMKKKK